MIKKLTILATIAIFTPSLQADEPKNNRFLGISTSKRSLIKKSVQATALLWPLVLEKALGEKLNLQTLALAEAGTLVGSYLIARGELGAGHAADVATRIGLVTLFYAIAQQAMPNAPALQRYGIPALAYLLVKAYPYEWWVKKYFKQN